jgi:hypothetical protein
MKFSLLVVVLVIAIAIAISYCYDHLAARRATRRDRRKLLAELLLLPPVKADFSTPEGAVLCFENARRQRNIEAAACRDFTTESRLWLQERGHLSQEKKDAMLPETIRAMEKSFRDSMTKEPAIDWERTKTFFRAREPFSDGLVVVNKITQMPDRSLVSQRILVAKTNNGWRIVKPLPNLPDDKE